MNQILRPFFIHVHDLVLVGNVGQLLIVIIIFQNTRVFIYGLVVGPEPDSYLFVSGNRRIIIIFIYCSWVVTRWQWLFYMYTKYEIGYY